MSLLLQLWRLTRLQLPGYPQTNHKKSYHFLCTRCLWARSQSIFIMLGIGQMNLRFLISKNICIFVYPFNPYMSHHPHRQELSLNDYKS